MSTGDNDSEVTEKLREHSYIELDKKAVWINETDSCQFSRTRDGHFSFNNGALLKNLPKKLKGNNYSSNIENVDSLFPNEEVATVANRKAAPGVKLADIGAIGDFAEPVVMENTNLQVDINQRKDVRPFLTQSGMEVYSLFSNQQKSEETALLTKESDGNIANIVMKSVEIGKVGVILDSDAVNEADHINSGTNPVHEDISCDRREENEFNTKANPLTDENIFSSLAVDDKIENLLQNKNDLQDNLETDDTFPEFSKTFLKQEEKVPLHAGSEIWIAKNELRRIYIPNAAIYTSRLCDVIFGKNVLENVALSDVENKFFLLDKTKLMAILTHVVQVFRRQGSEVNDDLVLHFLDNKLSNLRTNLKRMTRPQYKN